MPPQQDERGSAREQGHARQPLGEVTNRERAPSTSPRSKGAMTGPCSLSGAACCPGPCTTARPGAVELYVGPMFAGKTTALLARVAQLEAGGGAVLLVKSALDDRYNGGAEVVSHAGARRRCYAVPRLAELAGAVGGEQCLRRFDVLAIDEAQFLPDLVEFVRDAADAHGQHVLVAGLDGDYARRRFGQVLDLVPDADAVVKLAGRCAYCPAPSLFSLRLSHEDRQALVGGADMYKPVCRRHHVALSLEQGALSLEQGALSLEQGALSLEQGALSLEQGPRQTRQQQLQLAGNAERIVQCAALEAV